MNLRIIRICLLAVLAVMSSRNLTAQPSFRAGWTQDAFATEHFWISGTGSRNNPLRRELAKPFAGDELFVRYRLRYDAGSIDRPGDGDGEFFVLWLDDTEGNNASTHTGNVPNVGLHVSNHENRFMVRFNSGNQQFGPLLEGDRDYLIVGRLWKSDPGGSRPFDKLDLWVDPANNAENSPLASTSHPKSISKVAWIGFATGAKTEVDDVIRIGDISVAESWRGILGLPAGPGDSHSKPAPKPKTVVFRKHVHPILTRKCFECHAGDDAEEGVRLDVLDEVLNRTSPRNAKESRLYQLVASGEMPPEGDPLNDEQLSVIANWIDEGLDWDEALLPTPQPESDHWAFRPIERPAVPRVTNLSWIRTPVDAFIAARQEPAGLVPNPPADNATLNRRLSLDLLGLPPDSQPDDGVLDVDELLSKSAYGERWARHWLDVARWAESNGHQHNRDRPHAWRYRDWVIDAFNDDLPYDAFLRRQIAGDHIRPSRPENLIATGFLAAARYSGNELDKAIQRNDILVDVANTTASAFLGLTLECAQCHTHKFDPISIRDYYRFQAFFSKGQPHNVALQNDNRHAREIISQHWELFDKVRDRIVRVKRKQGHPEPIYVTPTSVVGGMNPREKSRFKELQKQIATFEQTWCFYSPSTDGEPFVVTPHTMRWPLPRDPGLLASVETPILIRGDVKSPGPVVRPGWPLVFGNHQSAGALSRLDLADWLVARDNPLTARVWVNRIWQWHFGRGLVETGNDFGTQGTPPSHPKLLDYLASELMDHQWSIRHIHRLILNSSTYRQSHRHSETSAAIDPENRLYWRWTPRRLEAEAIRDSMLAASGQLDRTTGGPGAGHDSRRRSVYLRQKRDALPAQQMLFDSANGIVSCSRRRVSTSALQPLWLMNSDFSQQTATKLATRAGDVQSAIRLAFGREPTTTEVEQLSELAREYGLDSACLAILNSSEFLYIP